MDNKLYSLLNWSIGKKMPPTQLQIHLTNKCNLKCGFCPTRATYKTLSKKELSKKKWKSVINEAISMGVKEFHICGGGEPLFYKDTALELMELIKGKQCHGELITNGTLLEEKDIQKLVQIGWDKILFSLNSSKSEIDDYLRSKGAYKKTIENIKKLSKLKKKLNEDKPFLGIHVVLCSKNYKDISGLIKLASEIGCGEVFFNSMNVWSNWAEKLKLNDEHYKLMKKEVTEAKKVAKELDIETNLDSIKDLESVTGEKKIDTICNKNQYTKLKKSFLNISCFAPWFNVSIFPHGDTRPCFMITGEGFSEDISKKKLKEIWVGKAFNKIRNDFMKNKINWNCKNCNVYNIKNNEEIKGNIVKYSSLVNLWDEIFEQSKLIKDKQDKLSIKNNELSRKISKIESMKMEIDSKKQNVKDLKQKIKSEKNRFNLEVSILNNSIIEYKKKAAFFENELITLYNSRGYKYILGPLDKVYSSIVKKELDNKKRKNKKIKKNE
jgi:AdoMet-dependent heme synthase